MARSEDNKNTITITIHPCMKMVLCVALIMLGVPGCGIVLFVYAHVLYNIFYAMQGNRGDDVLAGLFTMFSVITTVVVGSLVITRLAIEGKWPWEK